MARKTPDADRFKIAACRGDHAGSAYLTLQHHTGAHVAIQHLRFERTPGEAAHDEQFRILQEASTLIREAMEFLKAQTPETCHAPESLPRVGPAPHEGEPPNPFGYAFGRD